MAKINPITEMMQNHSDPEIVEYLYRLMVGVLKNYKNSVSSKTPEMTWASLGDIENVVSTLQAMYKRDQARLAQAQTS